MILFTLFVIAGVLLGWFVADFLLLYPLDFSLLIAAITLLLLSWALDRFYGGE